ncbi:MAG: hypothetical protein NVSMB44_05240 [Ktedonobacteraceae bacterium]
MLSSPRALLGKTIGSYRLSKLIGIGGTGAVFLGSGDDGCEMAVKVLIPPLLVSDGSLKEFHKRFRREAEILSQLDHPHILPVKAFGTDEDSGFSYMVMTYKSGGTLVEQIEVGPLPFDRVMKYVRQLSQALSYAHGQNIIHRDIKPANVLLDEDGEASLADFGIAKLFNLSTTTLTSANQILGTPAYMAPEQVSNKLISPATDIYGLGVLTYQLLTGCLPFSVSTLLALLQHIVQENPPPPHGIRSDLPAATSEILFKAMAKDPGARFASVEAFALALEQSMLPVLLHPATATTSIACQKDARTPDTTVAPGLNSFDDEVTLHANNQHEADGSINANNTPTLLAHYDTSPLEDECVSSISTSGDADNTPTLLAHYDAPLLEDKPAPTTAASAMSASDGPDAIPAVSSALVALPDFAPQDVSPTPAPLAPQDALPLKKEPETALPAEHKAVEAVETVAALVSLETPSPVSSPVLNLAASDLKTNTLTSLLPPVQTFVHNQSAGIRATIAKASANVGFKRPRPRWQVMIAAILVLLVVGESAFALYEHRQDPGIFSHQAPAPGKQLSPATSAVIGITPDSKTLQKTFIVSAVIGPPDASQHQVLARWIYNATNPQQHTVNASGKVSIPATAASGTLLFTNSSFTGSVIIPAGTLLTSHNANTGIQIILDEAVNLHPAPLNYIDPLQRPTQRVRAHAATGGTIGNIAAQKFYFTSMACVPMSPVCYSAVNDAPFIGGTDAQNYTFVQQSDIDGATQALQNQTPDAQQVLQGQLSPNEQWVILPTCKPQTVSNHAANDKAASVTVTITFGCSGEAYDQKGAMETAKQELKELAAKDPGDDYALRGDVDTTLQSAQLIDDKGNVTIVVATQGKWVFQLSATQKQELVKAMAGKQKLTVQNILKTQKGIKDASIQLYDGDQNTFPNDPQQITIHNG